MPAERAAGGQAFLLTLAQPQRQAWRMEAMAACQPLLLLLLLLLLVPLFLVIIVVAHQVLQADAALLHRLLHLNGHMLVASLGGWGSGASCQPLAILVAPRLAAPPPRLPSALLLPTRFAAATTTRGTHTAMSDSILTTNQDIRTSSTVVKQRF